jgi:hypothetical protein
LCARRDAAHHSPVRTLLIGLAITLMVAACKEEPGEGAPSSASPAAPTAPSAAPTAPAAASAAAPAESSSGSCKVVVEGAVQLEDTAPGGQAAISTDYWLSEENLRSVVTYLEKDPAKIDAAMKADPRFMTLLINCKGTRSSISFVAEKDSRYADIPFKPRKYQLGTGKPGSFKPLVLIDRNAYRTKGGTLDVTRFDDTGLAATFQFKATDIASDNQVTVRGTIDLACPPGYDRCKR